MCARLGGGLDLLELGSSPGDLLHVVLTRHHSHNNPAAQRHLLRGAVSALPLPKPRLLSRRKLDRQTHVGRGMRHSKSHKLCLVIYRTLH